MRFRPLGSCTLAIVVLVLMFPDPLLGQNQFYGEDEVLSAIQAAWTQRQQKVNSARVTWVTRKYYPKGSIASSLSEQNHPAGPAQDMWTEKHSTLILEGDKFHYSFQGQGWSHEQNRFLPESYTSVFNGSIAKTLHPPRSDGNRKPQGDVGTAMTYLDHRFSPIIVINSTLRPVHPMFRRYDFQFASVKSGRIVVQGHPCYELRFQEPNSPSVSLAYVDPARDFVVVRMVEMNADRVNSQTNIQYSTDPIVGWMPQEWEHVVARSDTNLHVSTYCSITSVALNGPTEDEEFDIVFPLGARVYDHTQQRFVDATGDSDQFDHVESLVAEETASEGMWVWVCSLALGVILTVAWVRWRMRQSDVRKSSAR